MREYVVEINGLPHTLQLSDEDAKAYGDRAKPVQSKQAEKPANKARTASDKK